MSARSTVMASALLLVLAGTAGAQEPPAEPARVPPGVHLEPVQRDTAATREDIAAELRRSRAAGTVTPDGEIGDTAAVLAARAARDAAQSDAPLGDAGRELALEAATAAAIGMSGAEAIADADVYEMTDDDGGLVGYLFVVEEDEAD